MLREVRRRGPSARDQLDERDDFLVAIDTPPDDGGLRDFGMRIEYRLDLDGKHVEAGADDELLQPALDEIRAIVRLAREVAGGEPSARAKRRGRRLRILV